MNDEMKDLTYEIEKLRCTMEKHSDLVKAQMIQTSKLYSDGIEPVKNYLRILVDKYQEDAGIKKIMMGKLEKIFRRRK